jgi:hypothetical protein
VRPIFNEEEMLSIAVLSDNCLTSSSSGDVLLGYQVLDRFAGILVAAVE